MRRRVNDPAAAEDEMLSLCRRVCRSLEIAVYVEIPRGSPDLTRVGGGLLTALCVTSADGLEQSANNGRSRSFNEQISSRYLD